MSDLRVWPKPHELENVIRLTPGQRAKKRRELFDLQCGICACGCGKSMCWEQGKMDTCTLEHREPNKAGCAKQDADWNLEAWRWVCNVEKGSKRIRGVRPGSELRKGGAN